MIFLIWISGYLPLVSSNSNGHVYKLDTHINNLLAKTNKSLGFLRRNTKMYQQILRGNKERSISSNRGCLLLPDDEKLCETSIAF
jgi:hypothetical protein